MSTATFERAIHDGEFELLFQPQVFLSSGKIKGFEALIRWNHPDLGLLSPDRFIPFAEESGSITKLSRWVIEQSVAQAAKWRQNGHKITVSANLSAADLHDQTLVDLLARTLREHDLAGDLFEVEITETMVMGDPAGAKRLLSRLGAMGIHLALDDFGTKFSPLTYLRFLPVSSIKLDKSFVMDMVDDRVDARIVRSLVDLAHNLGLRVTAEGVETEQIWSLLKVYGCDILQGFFISPPMTAEAVAGFIASWEGPQSGRDRRTALPADVDVSLKDRETENTVRVLIVDDHTLLRQSLVKTVAREPGFMVVGQAGRADEALETVRAFSPDLALLDISLPGMDGIEFAHQLRRTNPSLRLLFLTMRDDDETIRRAVEVGADGYVTKNASTEELLTALRSVAAGDSYLSPNVALRVMSMARTASPGRRAS